MKTFTLSIFLTFAISTLFAQSHRILHYNWSDSLTYSTSPKPIITGNTLQSDSVAASMNAKEVYEYDGVFYFINSWADYYMWYTTKYNYKFHLPELYRMYYNTKDNYNMVRFVSQNFKGTYYPSRVVAYLGDEDKKNDYYLEHWMKKITADNERKERMLIRSHEEEKDRYNNGSHVYTDDSKAKTDQHYINSNSVEKQSNDEQVKSSSVKSSSSNETRIIKEEHSSK